ncbi:MarR family transcriptional regulator [Shewanella benthica]|nr:MarR family transcriptional regulator [Shewanella benthica]
MKSTEDQLNHVMVEFYEKLSSWELAVVKDNGYSLPQIHTVEILGGHGPLRMKELAEKLGVTTGTLTVQIDKMVKSDLVTRMPHESDRRSILVELTEQGQALYREHDALHLQLTGELTAEFSDAERVQLLSFMKRINAEF